MTYKLYDIVQNLVRIRTKRYELQIKIRLINWFIDTYIEEIILVCLVLKVWWISTYQPIYEEYYLCH